MNACRRCDFTPDLDSDRHAQLEQHAGRVCQVDNCSKPTRRRGLLCSMHQARVDRHGNYDGIWRDAARCLHFPPETPAAMRFEAQVDRLPGSGCWIWTGRTKSNGYGRLSGSDLPAHGMYAHRWSYQHHIGAIGEWHVMHSCDTPACVNPAHLSLGTRADNMADMARKGRSKRKTCRRGHEWTEANTRSFTQNGYLTRRCRTCRRAREKR